MKKHNKIFKILVMVMVIVLMTGCEEVKPIDFTEACVYCSEDIAFPTYLVKLVANIIEFVKLMVPVFIILVGMIELFKAVIASDEKKMAESKEALIRKFVAGIVIFLIVAIVQFAFTVIPDFSNGDIDAMECVSFFINGNVASSSCPARAVGHEESMADRDDKDIKMPGGITQEDVDKIKVSTFSGCKPIENSTDCLKNGCEWRDNEDPHCVPKGFSASENKWGCYENQSQPKGKRQRMASKQSPGNSWVLIGRDFENCEDDPGASGASCYDITKEETCNKQPECQYINNQCIPKGSSSTEQKACFICKIGNDEYYTWTAYNTSGCYSEPVYGKGESNCSGKVPSSSTTETTKTETTKTETTAETNTNMEAVCWRCDKGSGWSPSSYSARYLWQVSMPSLANEGWTCSEFTINFTETLCKTSDWFVTH